MAALSQAEADVLTEKLHALLTGLTVDDALWIVGSGIIHLLREAATDKDQALQWAEVLAVAIQNDLLNDWPAKETHQ